MSITRANARAAEANERTEELRKQNLELQRDVERERIARLKIEQQLADRVLTDAQVKRIAEALKSFAGQEYEFTTYEELREPRSLAGRIYRALTQADWKYTPPRWREGEPVLPPGVAGVLVFVHPGAGKDVKAAADSLVSALVAEGIKAERRYQDATADPRNRELRKKLSLSIGIKP